MSKDGLQAGAKVIDDGKADAIIYYNGEWWIALSNGNGLIAYTKWKGDDIRL